MMAFFTILVLIGLNKSFALIHILPDRIMRWIGQPGEQTSVEQDLSETKGGAGTMEKGLSDAGSIGAQGAAGVQEQANVIGQKKRQQRKDDADETAAGSGGAAAS